MTGSMVQIVPFKFEGAIARVERGGQPWFIIANLAGLSRHAPTVAVMTGSRR